MSSPSTFYFDCIIHAKAFTLCRGPQGRIHCYITAVIIVAIAADALAVTSLSVSTVVPVL
jgi:hypothetical protein